MRSGPNTRRMRGRGNGNPRRGGGSPRSHNFDSNGPGIKVRGNAQQVVDKYQTLAREATIAGDRVMAENYNQHAEHYYRILSAQAAENQQNQQQNNQRNQNQDVSGSDRPQNQPNTQADNRNGARQENGAEQANGVQPIEVLPVEQTARPAVEASAVEAPAAQTKEQAAAPAAADSEEAPKPRTRRTPRRRTTPRPAPVEGTSETTS